MTDGNEDGETELGTYTWKEIMLMTGSGEFLIVSFSGVVGSKGRPA